MMMNKPDWSAIDPFASGNGEKGTNMIVLIQQTNPSRSSPAIPNVTWTAASI
ncbi:hypothetical protein ACPJHQ_16140 [Rossellomorea sp. H39__3]